MSRAIGGRTNLASRAQPIFVPPPIRSADTGLPTEVEIYSSALSASGTMAVSATGTTAALTFTPGANWCVAVVSLGDSAVGSTTIALGSPTLSGCGVTWALVGGPYMANKAALYGAFLIFAGFGTVASGTLTFGLGTTLTRATNWRIDPVDIANVDSVRQTAEDFDSTNGVTASAALSGIALTGGGLGVVFDVGVPTSDGSYVNSASSDSFRAGGHAAGGCTFFADYDASRGGNLLGPTAAAYEAPVTLASSGSNGAFLFELAPTV